MKEIETEFNKTLNNLRKVLPESIFGYLTGEFAHILGSITLLNDKPELLNELSAIDVAHNFEIIDLGTR